MPLLITLICKDKVVQGDFFFFFFLPSKPLRPTLRGNKVIVWHLVSFP